MLPVATYNFRGTCSSYLGSGILRVETASDQVTVVKDFLGGKDVFVSFPTGSRKFLCYCLLPKAFDVLRGIQSVGNQSIVVVVSPLVLYIHICTSGMLSIGLVVTRS